MNKAFIFCNNNYKNFILDIELNGLIVAADGGANYLQSQNIKPDLIIGDLDSISSSAQAEFKAEKTMKYSADKDFSDTELAIKYCRENDYDDITIVNATGEELSHTLANIFIIEKYLDNCKFHLYNKNSYVHYITDELSYKTEVGNGISLIPLTEAVLVEKTDGLQYALQEEKLYRASSRGISNRAEKNNIFIKLKSGILLLVIQR